MRQIEGYAKEVTPAARQVSTSDSVTSAANTAAVITLPAPAAGFRNVVTGLALSYSGIPTAGSVKIEDGSGNTVFQADITLGGLTLIPFPTAKGFTPATATIITLAAGGAGITGRVNVLNAWVERTGTGP